MFSSAPNPALDSKNSNVVPMANRSRRMQRLAPPSVSTSNSLLLLETIMEGLIDGVLIVTTQGHIVQMNLRARDICRQLNALITAEDAPSHQEELSGEVWRVCEALIDSRELFNDAIVPESEIRVEKDKIYRIRVRWLRFEVENEPCILVTLEDRQQSIDNMAIADSQKYGLTEREAEVWHMRLLGYSYQQIAKQLYIAENTVKKHIKSIFSKRRSVLGELEDSI